MSAGILSWRCIQNNKKNWLSPVLANSLEHEVRKFVVCYFLRELGVSFFVEAVFNYNKGRADIYLPDRDLAIEILESEKEERFDEKRLSYPCRVVAVRPELKLDLDTVEKLVN